MAEHSPFDASRHAALMAATLERPHVVYVDDLTHKLAVDGDLTVASCRGLNATRLHELWEFVNCPRCREGNGG